MKCINTSCQSTSVEIIEKSEGTVLDNSVNLLGAAICAIGCLTPFHYAAGKAVQECWRNGTKGVKVKYKCKNCGCTWEETKWT